MVAEYCDRAASGGTDDGFEFQRMIANAGEVETVLVYMMDRFSRDFYDVSIYKKKLRDTESQSSRPRRTSLTVLKRSRRPARIGEDEARTLTEGWPPCGTFSR